MATIASMLAVCLQEHVLAIWSDSSADMDAKQFYNLVRDLECIAIVARSEHVP